MYKVGFIYYNYIKKNSLNKVLDQQNKYFIQKTDDLNNRFSELFFSCIISNESIDMYDFFIEMKIPYMTIDKNTYQVNMELIKTIYKWIAVYYIVNFSNYIQNEEIIINIKKNLYYIYDFNQNEKELFENFLLLNNECEISFQFEFIQNISKNILNNSSDNLLILGLFYNLLYNSYNNFVNSYTRYIDIESWLKYA